ncbi:ABC transporter permease [Leifsonia sp. P73]|uniref:ABC transporter permease n=1 Tax=Leifsonia sp. P73 TaxID=3423959 RepID=UPI003DA3EF45
MSERETPASTRSALRELSAANARELMRNGKSVFSVLFMFGFFLILIWALNYAINIGNRAAPSVLLDGESSASSRTTDELSERGIDVVTGSKPSDSANAVVTFQGAHANVVLGNPMPNWSGIVGALEASGFANSDIAVVDAQGTPVVDLFRSNLAATLMMGYAGVAFLGTSVPLVALRRRGTLRLLGTTPLRRLTFILAQTPIRFGIGAIQALIVIVLALGYGYVGGANLLRLIVTLLLGLALFFALGYLLASRSRNPDLITQISGVLPVIVLFLSGSVFPMYILPDWVQQGITFLPTTWFVQAASSDLVGSEPFLNVYVLWAMMATATVLLTLVASKLFKWDRTE